MADPATHYHRIETYDAAQDTMYYLTRLEGQLVRLNELTKHSSWINKDVALATLKNAQAFATMLRNSLDKNRTDVV